MNISLSPSLSRTFPIVTKQVRNSSGQAGVLNGLIFQTEKIGRKANLHRLRSLPDHPSNDLRYVYTSKEIDTHHIRLVEESDIICERAENDQSIGFHGTAGTYRESLAKKIEYRINNQNSSSLQLGEGFYVAIGEQAETMAYLFATEAASQVGKKTVTDNDGSALQKEQRVKKAILDVKAESFASMKGLVLPTFFCWNRAVEPDGPEEVNWLDDNTKRAFIEEYDYIMSMIEIPKDHIPCIDLMQIKFNPCALDKLRIG